MKEQQRKHLAEHTHPCMCILALIHTFSGPNSASTHEDNRYSPTIHHPRLPHDHMTTVSRVSRVLTPANEQVCGEVAVLGEDHEHQQVVQVQPLHQQPEEVGHHTVVAEHHRGLASHLHTQHKSCGPASPEPELEPEPEPESLQWYGRGCSVLTLKILHCTYSREAAVYLQ